MQYRLIAHKLRVQRGPGNEDYNPTRPRVKGGGAFLDSDEKPTLVEFDAKCQVDVADLLKMGAIVEYKAPAKRKRGGK